MALPESGMIESMDMPTADDRSNLQRMLAGDWYIAEDPEIAALASRCRSLLDRFNATDHIDERRVILREMFRSVGDDATITRPLYCEYGSQLTIGDRFFANTGLVALDVASISIGDDVLLGPNVQLLTPTHPIEPEPRIAKWEAAYPITIGNNVWVGGGAIILGGITVGDDSVVGAGSVVTRDVPARVVVAGNPARALRSL